MNRAGSPFADLGERGGKSITEVAADWGVSLQTVHTWLARYGAGGLEQLANQSHRAASRPH
jgi:transposase